MANVQVVERFFDAAARRDTDAMRELTDPDVEWHTTRELPGGGVFRGQAAVEEVLRDQADTFDDFSVEPEQVREVGEQVVVFARLSGRIKGTGHAVEQPVGQVWTVRDGRVVRFRAYLDREEAMRVAQEEMTG